LHDLLQDVPIQGEVRDQALEPPVLLAQLAQLTELVQSQSRILLLPDVERRFADPVLAADLGDSRAALRLTQCPQNLLFRMSLLRHLRVLLVLVQRTTLAPPNSTYRWLAFRVLGQSSRAQRLTDWRCTPTFRASSDWLSPCLSNRAASIRRCSNAATSRRTPAGLPMPHSLAKTGVFATILYRAQYLIQSSIGQYQESLECLMKRLSRNSRLK